MMSPITIIKFKRGYLATISGEKYGDGILLYQKKYRNREPYIYKSKGVKEWEDLMKRAGKKIKYGTQVIAATRNLKLKVAELKFTKP